MKHILPPLHMYLRRSMPSPILTKINFATGVATVSTGSTLGNPTSTHHTEVSMAVTNILEDINQIAVTMATLDHSHMDSLYDALATRIAGTGAKDVAEAIESIRAAGEDPGKFIPVARSYQRQQQLAQRNAL